MADACARRNVPLLAFSSPFVFDGKGERPYVESDAPSPGCAWGKLQARAEELLLEINPRALLVRTSALFGAADRSNFIMETLRALEGGKPVQATADAIVSPTFVPDLVHAALELLIDGEKVSGTSPTPARCPGLDWPNSLQRKSATPGSPRFRQETRMHRIWQRFPARAAASCRRFKAPSHATSGISAAIGGR